MVDDILLTPEEQDERARQWLKDNGLALVLGVALGLGAVFGYQQWQAKLLSDAEHASALYNRALTSIQNSELADITAEVTELKESHSSSPYAVKASLLRAKQLSVSDAAAAVAELQWAADNADEPGLFHAAQIRQAKLLVAQGELEQAKAIANSEISTDFSSNYAEILGDIARLQGDFETARSQYQKAIDQLAAQDQGYAAILNLKLNRLPAAQANETGDADSSADASEVSE